MKFNFPNKEEGVLITIKLNMPLFLKIKQIAEDQECLRSEIIMIFLETAMEDYLTSDKRESTAYPSTMKEENPDEEKNSAAVSLGRLGGLKGGDARAAKLSPERRKEISQNAVKARWAEQYPFLKK